ncbi:MAG: hypothetical protein AB1414_08250 [bacterium]
MRQRKRKRQRKRSGHCKISNNNVQWAMSNEKCKMKGWLQNILDEAEELCKMIGKSILTARTQN